MVKDRREKIDKKEKESTWDFLSGIPKDKLTLEKETAKVNKKEVYVIKANVSGEDFKKAEGEMEEYLDKLELGEMDLSKLSMDVTFKIYKDTKLPAVISFKVVDGMNEMLEGIMGDMGVDITIDKCVFEVTFDAYDKVKKIEIPKEAKNAKEEKSTDAASDALSDLAGGAVSDEDDYTVEQPALDENGYYDIEGYGKTLKVKNPDGYKYSSSSSKQMLSFEKTSKDYRESEYVVYRVDEYYDEYERFAVEMQREDAEYYTEEAGYTEFELQDVKTIEANGMTIKYIVEGYKSEFGYTKEYQMWTVLSDNRVAECNVGFNYEDKIDVGDETAYVTTLMSAIQP